jgi:hypothetical protein
MFVFVKAKSAKALIFFVKNKTQTISRMKVQVVSEAVGTWAASILGPATLTKRWQKDVNDKRLQQ